MAFDFVCPFCHSKMRVDDRFAGQTGPCAECGKSVTLPSPASLGKDLSVGGKVSPNNEQSPSQVVASDQSHRKSSGQRWFISPRSKHLTRVIVMGGSLGLLFGMIGWLLVPSARRAFEQRRKLNAISNIQQIAKALNAYQRNYGSYPTPTVVDRSGKALYSWRVLILPYLGYKNLYERFQLNQAWDSPSNITLLSEMPQVFVCPGNETASSLYESNFALVVGPGTLFPSPSSVSVQSIADDPAETLLVVETREGGIAWTQPGNLDNSSGIRIRSKAQQDIGGNFESFVVVAMVDGNAVVLNSQTPQSAIQAMLTPNGNEASPTDSFVLEQ